MLVVYVKMIIKQSGGSNETFTICPILDLGSTLYHRTATGGQMLCGRYLSFIDTGA
jgi:hypothetical protein